MLIVVMFVSTAGMALGAGWWLRGFVFRRLPPAAPPQPPESEKATARARDVLSRLHDMATRMAEDVGAHSSRVQEISDELNQSESEDSVFAAVEKLIESNEQMRQQLQAVEVKLQKQAEQIEVHVHEARTDSVTRIANRRAFDTELARCEERLRKNGRTSTLMMVDIDHFKRVNDQHGHQAGDHVLCDVAQRLRRQVGVDKFVARYGGEEFAVIFPGKSADEIQDAAERLRASIGETSVRFASLDLRITASAGLASLFAGEDPTAALKRADDALYASKAAGRDCGHYHDGQTISRMETATAPVPEEQVVDEPALDPRLLDTISGRDVFMADLVRRLSERRRFGHPISVLLLRLDQYTGLFEEHGKQGVTTVLVAILQLLKAALRETDHIARYDAQTFALALPGAPTDGAIIVAERLRFAVEQCELHYKQQTLGFTISVGGAEAAGETPQELIANVSKSLHVAAQAGGDRCYFFVDGSAEPVSLLLTSRS